VGVNGYFKQIVFARVALSLVDVFKRSMVCHINLSFTSGVRCYRDVLTHLIRLTKIMVGEVSLQEFVIRL